MFLKMRNELDEKPGFVLHGPRHEVRIGVRLIQPAYQGRANQCGDMASNR